MDDEEVERLQQSFSELSLILTTEGAAFEEPKHTPNSTQIIEAPKTRAIHSQHSHSTYHTFGKLDDQLPDADWRTWFMVQDDPTHSVQQKMRLRLGNQPLPHRNGSSICNL